MPPNFPTALFTLAEALQDPAEFRTVVKFLTPGLAILAKPGVLPRFPRSVPPS